MTQGRAAALADSVIETGYTSLVLDRLAKQACQITDAEQSSLLVRDPAMAGRAIVVAGCGSDDLVGTRLKAAEGLTGRVLASGGAFAGRQTVAAPVSWDGRVAGVLGTSTSDPRRRFGPREVSLLEDLAEVAAAALLHDLGKLAVPREVIAKPGPLTENEAALVRGHPRLGADLLATVAGMEPAATIVRFHHERWDGTGYPDGLRRRAIPLASRIITACDAYDAMTSNRPYRRALPPEKAMEQLRAGSGSQFDPEVVECLVEAIHEAPGSDRKESIR